MSSAKIKNEKLYDEFFLRKTFDTPALITAAKNEIRDILKITKLVDKATVLDVACGSGRHLKALSNLGFKCAGVDISGSCIKIAKQNCPDLTDQLYHDDFINFSKCADRKYDMVLIVGASFGYQENEDQNLNFLNSAFNVTTQNGHLVIQFINRMWAKNTYKKKLTFWVEEEEFYVLDRREYVQTKLKSEKIFINRAEKSERKYRDSITTYTRQEIFELMDLLKLKYEVLCENLQNGAENPSISSGIETIIIKKL